MIDPVGGAKFQSHQTEGRIFVAIAAFGGLVGGNGKRYIRAVNRSGRRQIGKRRRSRIIVGARAVDANFSRQFTIDAVAPCFVFRARAAYTIFGNHFLLDPVAAALEILCRRIGTAILRHSSPVAARIIPIQMAAVAFFGKIWRAVGIAGIVGNTLAGNVARFVGQTGTAIYRAAAIVIPDAAQFAQ